MPCEGFNREFLVESWIDCIVSGLEKFSSMIEKMLCVFLFFALHCCVKLNIG